MHSEKQPSSYDWPLQHLRNHAFQQEQRETRVSAFKMKTVLAFLLVLPLSAQAQTRHPDLLKVDRGFDSIIAKRGLEGWMSFMSEDTVLSLWDPLQPLAGREAIRKFLTDYFAIPGMEITLKPNAAHLSPSGNTGYTVGNYEWVIPNTVCHCTNHFRGTYIAVWRLGNDAQWKVKSFTVVEESGMGCGCGN